MKKISTETGLRPGEKNDTVDLDYCGCLGYCSRSPNVEIDDTHIIFDTSPETIMDDIKKGGQDMSGQELSLDFDKELDNDFLGDLEDTFMNEDTTTQEYKEAQDSDEGIKRPDGLPEDISQGIRPEGKIRRIVVDRQACIAARSCVVVAPGVFQMDNGDLAYVVDGHKNTDEDTVVLAAQSCPVLAIHLFDEDGNRIFPDV